MKNKVILASASPRRRELLAQIGIETVIIPSDTDEEINETDPARMVMELSARKAVNVAERTDSGEIVLGADTIVVLDGGIFGKPKDEADAVRMLRLMSGKAHAVMTGVTLAKKINTKLVKTTFYEQTDVYVYPLSDEEINWYIARGEYKDKAGAYGIQGYFAAFIEKIHGDYTTIVGLPAGRVYQEIKKFQRGLV